MLDDGVVVRKGGVYVFSFSFVKESPLGPFKLKKAMGVNLTEFGEANVRAGDLNKLVGSFLRRGEVKGISEVFPRDEIAIFKNRDKLLDAFLSP